MISNKVKQHDKTWGIKDIPKKLVPKKQLPKLLSKETANNKTYSEVRGIQFRRFQHAEMYERDYGGISKVYWRRVKQYGSFIDLLTYDKATISHKTKGRVSFAKTLKTEKREDSVNRTKQNVFRLVHSNVGKWGDYRAVFFTLTFKKNITDPQEANKLFRLFIMRLNHKLGTKLEYVAIIEFQVRGAVHYHGIFFNLPWIDKFIFEKTWGYGFTNMQTFRVEKAISSYLTKYITKAFFDKRLYGQRSTLTSRGLYRPIESYDDEEIDYILNTPKEEVYKYSANTFEFTRYKTT